MTPNPTDVDEILDDCLLEVTAGRLSIEDCLQRHPQVAAQLEPLLRTATKVWAIPRASGLNFEKRRAIEQQLLNRAVQFRPAAASRQSAAPAHSLRLRLGLIAIVFCALLVSGLGFVTASASSLPGEMLYPVKRWTEQISLATASSSSQASLHVDLARRRLDEFEALAARDDVRPELMTEASTSLAAALQTAAVLPVEQQQVIASAVIRLADVQAALTKNSSAAASATTRASLEASAATASAARERALHLVEQPPSDSATTVATDTPTSTLTSIPSETATVAPTSTVVVPTEIVGAKPTLPNIKPTSKPTNTARPPNTPPGLVKTPNTPPGQVKTPKPDTVPPGQVKTPKPKK